MVDTKLQPAPGVVVRGHVKVAGRSIVAPLAAVGSDGLDFRTLERGIVGEATVRCLGRPKDPPIVLSGWAASTDDGVRVAWPADADRIWPALAALMGLPPDTRRPAATRPVATLPPPPAPRSLAAPVRPPPLPGPKTPPPDATGLGASTPTPNAGLPGAATPPASGLSATATPAASSAPGKIEETRVVVVPLRPLVAALARAPGELSPMVELDGVAGLQSREVVVAQVSVGDHVVLLEGTVVTVRGARARVRLAIPSPAVRGFLERAA